MPTANQEPQSSSFSSNGEVAECSKLFGEDDTGKERGNEKAETQYLEILTVHESYLIRLSP
jgi:hypothetical protein